MACELLVEVARDIARGDGGADLARLERRHLLVQGADAHALLVAHHRAVDGAGDVVFGKFCRGAHVDDLVKLVALCYGRELEKHR
ncbi:hypothetical protein D3C85_1472850 [compost metagenome]